MIASIYALICAVCLMGLSNSELRAGTVRLDNRDTLDQLSYDAFSRKLLAFDHKDFRAYFHRDLQENGPIFIFFGGAKVQVERYNILARKLISDIPGSAFLIPKFAGLMANPIQAKAKVRIMLDQLKELGWENPKDQSFLLAHSQGGIMAHSIAEPLGLRGLILLGSYLPRTAIMGSQYKASTYPLPILTLGTELDGLTGINFMAREYEDVLSRQKENPNSYSHEVWVLPGLNHMHFADGGYLDNDIPSDISLDEGHQSIIEAITTFTRLNMPDAYIELRSDLKGIAERLRQQTKVVIAPILAAKQLDHKVCELSQRRIASSLGRQMDISSLVIQTLQVDNFFSFVIDKSKIQELAAGPINDGGDKELVDRFIYAPYYVETPPNITDISLFEQLAPATIACKMRNSQSVYESFFAAQKEQVVKKPDNFDTINCVDLNRQIIADTINLLTEQQRIRLDERIDLDEAIQFELVSLPSGIQWLSSFFGFSEVQKGQWLLRTQQLRTALDTKPAAFAGAHYCKVIAPSRFMNWLLIESVSY